ncbi:hypothetical protein K435DRAFT_804872 [Dendrothele bispora CBS 962.96]|uniref:Uncharacterized protein n=1 Tax=Dendrothele bispora (strain CBS 962.96) TaxID=1314807 RepID=A0A4S8LDM6_DENBC|nr:hypothetical protein K435DRAFT_804872 [Dendrothele bispora CBS 962.96]
MANSKTTKATKSSTSTSNAQSTQSDTVELRGRSVERAAPALKARGNKKDLPEPIPEHEDQSSDAALAAQLVGAGPNQTAPPTVPAQSQQQTITLQDPAPAPEATIVVPAAASANAQTQNQTSNLQDPVFAATIAEQAAASAKKRSLRVNAVNKPKPRDVFHDASDNFNPTFYPVSPSYPSRALEDDSIAQEFRRRLEQLTSSENDKAPSSSKQLLGKDKGKRPIRGDRESRYAETSTGLGSSLDKNPFYSLRPRTPTSPTARRSRSASPASRSTSESPTSPKFAPHQTKLASLFVTPQPTTLLTTHVSQSAPATVIAPASITPNDAVQNPTPYAFTSTSPPSSVIPPTAPITSLFPVTHIDALPSPPVPPTFMTPIPTPHTTPPPPPPPSVYPPPPPPSVNPPPPPPSVNPPPPPPPPPSVNPPPFPPVPNAIPPPPPPPPVIQPNPAVTTFPVDWPERIHGFTTANRLFGLVPAQEQQWDNVDTTTTSKVLVQRTGGYPTGDTPSDIGQAIAKAFETIFQVTPYIGAPGLNESGRVDQSCPWYLVYNIPPHVAASVVGRAWSVRDIISFIAIPYDPLPSSYIFTLDSIWLMNLEARTTAEQFVANVITRTWRKTPAIMQFLTTFRDALPEDTTIDQYLQTLLVRPLLFKRKTVYRVYITPPTNQLHLYDTWLSLVLVQPYVFVSGVGKALSHFKCSWCRSIDHPSNFCPWTKYVTWHGPSAATQAAANLNAANNSNQPYVNNNPSSSSYPGQYQDNFNNGYQNQGGSRGGYRGGYRGNFRGGYNDTRGRGSRRSRGSRGGRGYFGGY